MSSVSQNDSTLIRLKTPVGAGSQEVEYLFGEGLWEIEGASISASSGSAIYPQHCYPGEIAIRWTTSTGTSKLRIASGWLTTRADLQAAQVPIKIYGPFKLYANVVHMVATDMSILSAVVRRIFE